MQRNDEPKATGALCAALGVDAKITTKGTCTRSCYKDAPIVEYINDGLPFPTLVFMPCIFNFNGGCAFAGECEYRSESEDEDR